MADHKITSTDIKSARRAFEAHEARDLFYRAATELVSRALEHATCLSVAEALAVLLQTWNKNYYRSHAFDKKHLESIEKLLQDHENILAKYRNSAIDNLDCVEQPTVSSLFQSFENVLGPVGAAKALHLLAPRFFPLWDRHIAKAYGLPLVQAGSNCDYYWRFMLKAQDQCRDLNREEPGCQNPLKSLDEFNYCKYTKRWWP